VNATIDGVVRSPSLFRSRAACPFHDRDARVGRAEIDADDFAHCESSETLTKLTRMIG
jgi:hypothetical protein